MPMIILHFATATTCSTPSNSNGRLLSCKKSGALLTAMSIHTPIAATNIGGLCDPLKIANVGWMIPTATFKDIQKVLKLISQSKECIEEIKNDKQVWKLVNTHFDWSTISKTTMATYQILMS